jgi:hypothetical protein
MQIYHDFNEMAAGTGALQSQMSQLSVFNADSTEYLLALKADYKRLKNELRANGFVSKSAVPWFDAPDDEPPPPPNF